MRSLRWLFACGLALLCSCASLDLTQRQWTEVEGGSFRIVSEIGRDETLRLFEELRSFEQIAGKILGVAVPPPATPIRIFALRGDTYAAFGPPQTGGYFSSGTSGLFIALDAEASISARAIIYHEYTHYVLDQMGSPSYPRWYHEGLAEVLRGTEIRDDGAAVGLPLENRIAELGYYGRRELASVVVPYASQFGAMSPSYYATAWALVHYLQLGFGQGFPDRRQQLVRCLQLLDAGVAAEEAFTTAFGVSLEDLDHELSLYLRGGRLSFGVIRLPPGPRVPPAVRSLDPSDAMAELGELALETGTRSRASATFETALALRPADPRLLSGLARSLSPDAAAQRHALVSRALERGGDDASVRIHCGFVWLSELAPPDVRGAKTSAPARLSVEERRQAFGEARLQFERALSSCPTCTEAEFGLGSLLLLPEGDAAAAREHLERAAQALPSNVAVQFQLATAYLRTGEPERARRLLQRQLQRAHETSWLPRIARRLAEAEAALQAK